MTTQELREALDLSNMIYYTQNIERFTHERTGQDVDGGEDADQ